MFKIVGSLSLIAGLRFFGLFVVMPVLALYVADKGDIHLAGFAVGAYAVSQIIFQVPFGILSEKYSKRAVIAVGLVIFIIGSLICAFATSGEMVIVGRIVQGAGAIGSVITAKIADLIQEEKRGKAMAFMGIAIFISFIVAMIVGSSVGEKYGTDKLFFLTALLSLFSIILLYAIVPKAPHLEYNIDTSKRYYMKILTNKNIMILNISVMLQKFLLTFGFMVIPLTLKQYFNIELWNVFSIASICGLFAIAPSMIVSEKYKRPKVILLIAVMIFAVAYLLMAFGDTNRHLIVYGAGVVLFFCAFCMQEPILQNLASKYPKMQEKSLSIGIFTTFGYIGSFLGAVVGGEVFGAIDFMYVAFVIIIVMIAWFALFLALNNPSLQENLYIRAKSANIYDINAINGVIESYINKSENLLVVKYDSRKITKDALDSLVRQKVAQ